MVQRSGQATTVSLFAETVDDRSAPFLHHFFLEDISNDAGVGSLSIDMHQPELLTGLATLILSGVFGLFGVLGELGCLRLGGGPDVIASGLPVFCVAS
jgi:hypothetical protein